MATYKEKRGTNVVPIVSAQPSSGVNGEIVYITGEGLASYNNGTWSKLTANLPPSFIIKNTGHGGIRWGGSTRSSSNTAYNDGGTPFRLADGTILCHLGRTGSTSRPSFAIMTHSDTGDHTFSSITQWPDEYSNTAGSGSYYAGGTGSSYGGKGFQQDSSGDLHLNFAANQAGYNTGGYNDLANRKISVSGTTISFSSLSRIATISGAYLTGNFGHHAINPGPGPYGYVPGQMYMHFKSGQNTGGTHPSGNGLSAYRAQISNAGAVSNTQKWQTGIRPGYGSNVPVGDGIYLYPRIYDQVSASSSLLFHSGTGTTSSFPSFPFSSNNNLNNLPRDYAFCTWDHDSFAADGTNNKLLMLINDNSSGGDKVYYTVGTMGANGDSASWSTPAAVPNFDYIQKSFPSGSERAFKADNACYDWANDKLYIVYRSGHTADNLGCGLYLRKWKFDRSAGTLTSDGGEVALGGGDCFYTYPNSAGGSTNYGMYSYFADSVRVIGNYVYVVLTANSESGYEEAQAGYSNSGAAFDPVIVTFKADIDGTN